VEPGPKGVGVVRRKGDWQADAKRSIRTGPTEIREAIQIAGEKRRLTGAKKKKMGKGL